MLKRKYIHLVEVVQTTDVFDGIAGNTLSTTSLGNSWCDVSSIPTSKMVEYGLNIDKQAIKIELRFRTDIDYKAEGIRFVYRSVTFIPFRVEQKDFNNEYVIVYATNV